VLGRWAAGAPVRRKRRRGPRPRYVAALAASGLRVPSHDSLWRFATYGGALGDDRRRTDRRIASAEGAGLKKRSDFLGDGFDSVETASKGRFFLLGFAFCESRIVARPEVPEESEAVTAGSGEPEREFTSNLRASRSRTPARRRSARAVLSARRAGLKRASGGTSRRHDALLFRSPARSARRFPD